MTTEEKIKLITRNLEETLTIEDLKILIESGKPLKHYIGYEVSGRLHIGQGLLVMQKIKDLQEAGVETTILIADWHTWLNNKLDGKLETAKRLGKEYLTEVLKASAICVGADPEKIEFVLGSEVYEKLGLNYWATVVKVAKATSLSRMIRSTTIMGRKESDISDSAMLIYPSMQSSDIFMMGVNIAHAGIDQRNVHVVAREAALELGFQKPICIHGHLLQGLLQPIIIENPETGKKEVDPQSKMSKSKPESGVYMTDSPDEIKQKINNAYCPEGDVEFNPILDWTKHLIFYNPVTFTVSRPEKFGGEVVYNSYTELEKDYADKKLHPMDLKAAIAEWLIVKLEPARKYFEDPKRKAALEEIERLTKK
jgi:tyrosyl-tRNA synthetase